MKLSIFALIGGLCLIVPMVVTGVTFTHFVTPNGSPTSLCSSSEPCSIARAVALAGGATIPPGSVVSIAEGIYSQAGLDIKGSGTVDKPIKFIGVGKVRFTASRIKPAASAWTLVPGRKYTYQLDWDEAGQFTALPVQRPPVANWRPIQIEDRRPPFTTPSSRRMDLVFPPLYSARTSINEVEAQAGTAWNDTTNNKIYVHLFDDTAPPTDGTNLYLMSGGWGTITINGDYIWLEAITIEHATPTGLVLNRSANGTILKRITALASSISLEGTNTVAEDLDISHVIRQRTDSTECYDANPDFGQGECWNANGIGQALNIGMENSAASFGQIVRRAFLHRSWNGAGIHGPNTLEHSKLWGFPNHTFGGGGVGVTIRHNVFVNGQDSIYFEREPFDDMTVEHNIFQNGALFRVAMSSGTEIPAVPLTKGFRFQHNILAGIVYDDKVTPALMSDCNVFIRPGAEIDRLVAVTGTEGRPSRSYNTLEQLHANTPWEAHSVVLPSTAWTDGSLFRRFSGQASIDFDFAQVGRAAPIVPCGKKVGPTTPPATPGEPRILR